MRDDRYHSHHDQSHSRMNASSAPRSLQHAGRPASPFAQIDHELELDFERVRPPETSRPSPDRFPPQERLQAVPPRPQSAYGWSAEAYGRSGSLEDRTLWSQFVGALFTPGQNARKLATEEHELSTILLALLLTVVAGMQAHLTMGGTMALAIAGLGLASMLWIGPSILAWAVRGLGGSMEADEGRVAIVWGAAPRLLLLPVVSFSVMTATAGSFSPTIGYSLATSLAGFWAFVAGLATISSLGNVGYGRAFLAVLLSGFIQGALAAPFVIFLFLRG